MRVSRDDSIDEKMLPLDEYKRLLESFNVKAKTGLKNYLMVRFMGELGLRTYEVVKLTWDCLSTDNEGAWLKLKYTKSGIPRQRLPIKNSLREALDTWRDRCGYPEGSRPIFPSGLGKKLPGQDTRTDGNGELTTQQLRRMFSTKAKALGLSRSNCHSLRHLALSRLANNENIPLDLVRRVAGHTNLRTTARYLHSTDDQISAAFDNIM